MESRSFPKPGGGAPSVVLVTGAAGFIGSHVAEMLLARGENVALIDELNDYYDVRLKRANLAALRSRWGNRVRIYIGDVADEDFLTQVFDRERPDRVVHLAARAGVRPSIEDPFVYIHANVEGTTRLLELARQRGVGSFVYASSSSVYGGSKSTYFSEEELVNAPVSPYAATKLSTELMAHTYHHLYGLNATGLRFFTVYGPRGRPDMAPLMFIDRISRGVPVTQFGDGTTSRDYTYVDDIADGVVRALDRPMGNQVYNLGRGSPVELSAFISTVEDEVGRPALIKVLPLQPGDVPRTCADVSKAERLLGYRPKIGIVEGIRRTVAWYREAYGPSGAVAAEAAEATEDAVRRMSVIYQPAAAAAASAVVDLGDAAAAQARRRAAPLSAEEPAWAARRSNGALALGPLVGALACLALVVVKRRGRGGGAGGHKASSGMATP